MVPHEREAGPAERPGHLGGPAHRRRPDPHNYRALIFVNGWQIGRYVNDVGPQHSFPIPNGVLNPNGDNSIAIAVWNTDATTGGLGAVTLESYGTQLTAMTPVVEPTGGPTASPTASATVKPSGGGQPGGSVSASPSATASSSASAGAHPGGLALTGSSIALMAGAGAVLVGVGLLLYVMARRRRAGFAGNEDGSI